MLLISLGFPGFTAVGFCAAGVKEVSVGRWDLAVDPHRAGGGPPKARSQPYLPRDVTSIFLGGLASGL